MTTHFVDECRQEWKRLGVPDDVAQDMAEELEADLSESSSPEDVLAGDAADPRSFARVWATERGVIPSNHRPLVPVAIAAVAITLAVVGAVLTIHHSRAAERSSAHLVLPARAGSTFGQVRRWAAANVQAGFARDRTILPQASSDDDSNTLGVVLLIIGLGLLVPLALYPSARTALGR